MRHLLSLTLLAPLLSGCAGTAESQDRTRHVLIGASGDVLFHTRVVEAGNEHGFAHLFGALGSIIDDDEVAFANLETPLSLDREPRRGNPPTLGAPPESAAALAGVGFDVLSVANNHAWDQRDTGMVATLATLREAGITPVGAAPNQDDAPGPIFMTRDGVEIAFFAFTTILQGHPGTRRPAVRIAEWNERRARRLIGQARTRAGVVVVSMHWGLGYRHVTRAEQVSRAHDLVRFGADVVLGHGPHVLQPVERVTSERGEAVIIYSLGNLISNQGYRYRRGRRERGVELPLREPATRDGVWFRVGLDVPSDGVVRIAGIEAVPLWTHNNFWDQERRRASAPDIRVIPASSIADADLRSDRRTAIGRVLGPAVHLLP